MRRSYPKRGEFWHHFKGNDYCILAVGHHSETDEEMVVYCRADGLDKNSSAENPCIRPLSMFMSEVDQKKKQKRLEAENDKRTSTGNKRRIY